MTESKSINPGDVIINLLVDSPFTGPHRVLEIVERLDKIIIIPIPVVPKQALTAKQKNYYARGFMVYSLSKCKTLLSKNVVKKTQIELPGLWFLADAAIEKLDSRNGHSKADNGKLSTSHALRTRDFKWNLIESIVPEKNGGTNTCPPDLSCLDAQVKARAREAKVSAGQVYDALHRFYAFGCIRNALLPNLIGHCGAPGKYRLAKNNKKLGRKNAAAESGNEDLAGLILTEEHIQNIQDGYVMYVRPGTTVSQAFFLMSAAFYSTGYSEQHGHLVPNLLPAHCRPTQENFKTHGPRAENATHAARQVLGEGEWERDYRPLVGKASDGIVTIGQVGSLDASPVDVNLVSCCDPLQPIGVGRGLFVRDVLSGLYLGWTIGMKGLGTDDAKLAILRAATDKSGLLARHKLDLPPEDFPSLFFTKYYSDNGELRSAKGIRTIGRTLGSRIHFVPSGRADLNSISESGHHTRHSKFDHRIAGTTKGRQKKRGETSPRTHALLSRFEYTRQLIIWIHWANTKQALALNCIPSEMRREYALNGQTLNPTRIEVFRWAQRNGYISGKPMDSTYLRAHLLPRFTASIRREGLILHRPDSGERVELLHGARFNSRYLTQSSLIKDALSSGQKYVEVGADPEDLSHVYLTDMDGCHAIPNIKDDPILISEGSIADLCAINQAQRISNVESASQRDQDLAYLDACRNEAQADAKIKKAAAKRENDSAKQRATTANIRAAQAVDQKQHLDNVVAYSSQVSSASVSSTSTRETVPDPTAQPLINTPTKVTRLQDHRMNRLLRLNNGGLG